LCEDPGGRDIRADELKGLVPTEVTDTRQSLPTSHSHAITLARSHSVLKRLVRRSSQGAYPRRVPVGVLLQALKLLNVSRVRRDLVGGTGDCLFIFRCTAVSFRLFRTGHIEGIFSRTHVLRLLQPDAELGGR